jgi:hypothetical protein
MQDDDYVILWEAPKIIPPEFRLYYNETGKVICYTCEKLDGNYIVIDASIYAAGRPDVRVIDGKISPFTNEFEFNVPTDKNGFKVSVKDTQLLKYLYFGTDSGTTKNNPLLPIELEITTLGVSGVTVGKICNIEDLPFNDSKGLLQVVEVNHTVDSALWQTSIKFKYRPGN